MTRHGSSAASLLSAALRHRWRAFTLATVVITGLLTGLILTFPRTYTAKTTVLLQPLAGNPANTGRMRDGQSLLQAMNDEAARVKSPAVIHLATRRLSRPLSSSRIAVAIPPNTQTLTIQVNANERSAARDGAGALAKTYLDHRSNAAQKARRHKLARFDKQAQATKELRTIAATAAKARQQPPADSSQVQSYASQISTLHDRIRTLGSKTVDPGFIVSAPKAQTTPIGGPIGLYLGAAALTGVLAGCLIAVRRESKTRDWHSHFSVQTARIPSLGALPPQELCPSSAGLPIVPAQPAEAYRTAAVTMSAVVPKASVIAFSSGDARGDIGSTTVKLALAFADAGYDVVMVDGTTVTMSPTTLLNLHDVPGLAEALRHPDSADMYLTRTRGIRVLAAGHHLDQSRDILANTATSSIFERLQSNADLVLVSAPPIRTASGQDICRAADATILTSVDSWTNPSEPEALLDHVNSVGIKLAGYFKQEPRTDGNRRHTPIHPEANGPAVKRKVLSDVTTL